MRFLLIILLSVAISACASRPKSYKSVKRVTETGDFVVTARLDPSQPRYASESVIKDHICQGLGQLKRFNATEGGFQASCGGPIFARKDIDYPNYPETGFTYLSFSDPAPGLLKGHGFQVSYYKNSVETWLWYPGNERSLKGDWKISDEKTCYDYGPNTRNPVTGSTSGFQCQSLEISRKLIVSRLDGDPFNLASGDVPSLLDKCTAPQEFEFDRQRFACSSLK